MPIRTNRGRAAVYRRLWGWPLRSPRHLVMTLIGMVVLAVVIGIAVARLHGTASPAATGGIGATSSGSTPATSTVAGTTNSGGGGSGPTTAVSSIARLTSPPETPVSAPPAPDALDVILKWGQLWVNHPAGMTNDQWRAQLAPYSTPELLAQMQSVDLGNIPGTKVTGNPTATSSYTKSVVAVLPTDAGSLNVTAIDTPDQGWLVSAYGNGQ